eukprot:scpid66675/ scgid34374/ 
MHSEQLAQTVWMCLAISHTRSATSARLNLSDVVAKSAMLNLLNVEAQTMLTKEGKHCRNRNSCHPPQWHHRAAAAAFNEETEMGFNLLALPRITISTNHSALILVFG